MAMGKPNDLSSLILQTFLIFPDFNQSTQTINAISILRFISGSDPRLFVLSVPRNNKYVMSLSLVSISWIERSGTAMARFSPHRSGGIWFYLIIGLFVNLRLLLAEEFPARSE